MALLARSRSELRRLLTQHEVRGDPRRAPWGDLPDHGPGPGSWARYCKVTHVADIKIDLQAIDLPEEALDTVLTPHVLEHVPDRRTRA